MNIPEPIRSEWAAICLLHVDWGNHRTQSYVDATPRRAPLIIRAHFVGAYDSFSGQDAYELDHATLVELVEERLIQKKRILGGLDGCIWLATDELSRRYHEAQTPKLHPIEFQFLQRQRRGSPK